MYDLSHYVFFNNILKNAFHYSYEHTIIHIQAYQDESYTHVVFENQGDTIPPDKIQNIFNIERDYVLQYYAFGILGCIFFLGMYAGLWVLSIVKMIKDFNYFQVLVTASITLFLLIAYLTGNIFSQIAIFIPLLFLSSITFIKQK